MAFSQIENSYMDMVAEAYNPTMPPEPELQEEPSLDGLQLAMGARGQSAKQRQKFESQSLVDYIGSEAVDTAKVVGGGIAEMMAATVKGAGQAFFGLPGDIEMIGRGVTEIFSRGGDESKVQAFLRGIQEKTILPTTDNIKKWIDTNIVTVGKGDNPMETIGEVLAPGGYIKGAKTAVKAAKKTGQELAPTLGKMAEDYMRKTGVLMDIVPAASTAVTKSRRAPTKGAQ